MKESSVKQIQLVPLLPQSDDLSWKVLPLEYIFAEKLQTMVLRGSQNSRGKDVYDMSLLSSELYDLNALETAIKDVFKKRSTDLPKNLQSFVRELNYDMLRQSWSAVKLKNPKSFDQSMFELTEFLGKLFPRS
jgi:predicted nucleotidyltransferase component of viral defense system